MTHEPFAKPLAPETALLSVPAHATGEILGVGFDLVEVPRIARALEGGAAAFRRHAFTAAEWDGAERRADRAAALAACFAAKEACLKALGTGWAEGISLHEVELVSTPHGRASLRLAGTAAARARARGVRRMHVSVTDLFGLAAATVVLEG